jgi:tRNA pseudouridine13 synthase
MKLIYPHNVQNDFSFNSSPRDFTVEEIPLYEFSGEGEHLIVHMRKKELTTWEMVSILSNHLGIAKRDIGYAGLKDKHAMTLQYLSLPAKYEPQLQQLQHEKMKILHMTKHNNKIRVGHLKGNRFKIRLKKVLGVQKNKLDSTLTWVQNHGIPNYFGHQRFGTNGTNWCDGKKILAGELHIRDKKTREFLIGSYQSYLFNQWLSKRMELNLLIEKFSEVECETLMQLPKGSLQGIKAQKNFFKLLEGDLMMHYPYGKLFEVEQLEEEAARFETKDIAPTGLVVGAKTKRAGGVAGLVESQFDEEMKLYGTRRYAWIQVEHIKRHYIEERAHYELSFALPKGSYATNMLDVLRGSQAIT